LYSFLCEQNDSLLPLMSMSGLNNSEEALKHWVELRIDSTFHKKEINFKISMI
jgi:hypothetical protein